jgi:tetratricopeptide (TPR) repeat protein
MAELFSAGANPQELASLAAFDPPRMIEVAAFLGSISRVDEANAVLNQSEALRPPDAEFLLTRAKLQLQSGKLDDAEQTLARAHAEGGRSSRLSVLDAELRVNRGGEANTEQALDILDTAATRDPFDLPVQQMRIDLITRFHRWKSVDRALEGFKQALFQARGSATEAHIAAARIYSQLGRWTSALGEYRIALSDQPGSVTLWVEYGHMAEQAGHLSTARDAYLEAARLSPNDPVIGNSLKTLDQRTEQLRQSALGLGAGEGDPK